MLKVNDLYPSIQGEGAMTGTPMIVLRLMGCSVGCAFCDTKETWAPGDDTKRRDLETLRSERGMASAKLSRQDTWIEAPEAEVVAYIAERWPAVPLWVLLTGGEPAEQPLAELVGQLHEAGRFVQIETSGTADGHVGAGCDWVTVSPKVAMPGGRSILPSALSVANEIKWVVGRWEDGCKLDEFLAQYQGAFPVDATVSVQPLSQNKTATEACVRLALERGWHLSLQTHKYAGLR